MMNGYVENVVIGGGQAGLAVGYHLRRRGLPFVILDENERVGDAWRKRWDSLRLFTPARYSGLPGLPFPGPPSTYPTKNETADYLSTYADRFELPVRNEVKVERVHRIGGSFELVLADERLAAHNVIVATGGYHTPRIPSFSAELDPGIIQLHSSEYRNENQLRDGAVLVVGAGNSGAEISLDIAGNHHVWLAGPATGQEPTRAGSIPDRLLTPLMWLGATRLTVQTRLGRRMRDHFLDPPRGIPLGRVRRSDIVAAGIERVQSKTTGVRNGYPALEDGSVLEASNVIWCTGFSPDYGWLDLPLQMRNGAPIHDRGVVDSVPGLYFIGLLFLYSLSSALLGGVGRDAEYIVDHVVADRKPGGIEVPGGWAAGS